MTNPAVLLSFFVTNAVPIMLVIPRHRQPFDKQEPLQLHNNPGELFRQLQRIINHQIRYALLFIIVRLIAFSQSHGRDAGRRSAFSTTSNTTGPFYQFNGYYHLSRLCQNVFPGFRCYFNNHLASSLSGIVIRQRLQQIIKQIPN